MLQFGSHSKSQIKKVIGIAFAVDYVGFLNLDLIHAGFISVSAGFDGVALGSKCVCVSEYKNTVC